MKRVLKQSLWVHAPTVLTLAAMLILPALVRPWPLRVPIHFDFHWRADGWGSPWIMMLLPALTAVFVLMMVAFGEVWTRIEGGRKRFNWVLIAFTPALGALAGIHFWYWLNIQPLAGDQYVGSGAWGWIVAVVVVNAAALGVLEWMREPVGAGLEPVTPSGSHDGQRT